MSDGAHDRLKAARELEARGEVDAASEAYVRAGSLGEAARVLAEAHRYGDAATLLMRALGRSPAELSGLDGRERRIAEKAAHCWELAGEHGRAKEIREALAERPRSSGPAPAPDPPVRRREAGWKSGGARVDRAKDKVIEDLVAAGRLGPAARVAWEAGRVDEAAKWFLELGFHYEAGMCLADLGEDARAFDELAQVATDHKRYRQAAARMIDLAARAGRFDFEVDRMVSPFLGVAPTKKSEVPAYLTAARLYEEGGFAATARDVVARVLEFSPDDEDARAIHDRLAAGAPASRGRRSIAPAREDSLPDLPALDSYIRPSGPRMKPVQRPKSVRPPPAASPPAPAAPPPAPASPVAAAPAAPKPATAPPPAPPVAIEAGAVVASRYRIDGQLGRGGMATVWRAHDLELGEDVALKVMHPGPTSEQWLPRFRQELSLARILTHKNIVRVFDIGVHGDSRFISMELLEGAALDEMLDQPIPVIDGIHYIVQACAGLRVAHHHGIVHRDIKPANLFITKQRTVKLTDFGIAKAPGSEGQAAERGLTMAGAVIGTPEYMSPEQIEDAASVTPSSDIYALGVCLYEMYTLTCPFEHEHPMQILRMHLGDAPPPPRHRNPHIPKALEEVILKCLEKAPADRYPSVTELARALRAVANELR